MTYVFPIIFKFFRKERLKKKGENNMYNYMTQGGDVAYGIIEFSADSRDDINKLPKCSSGSTCIVIEDGSVWMIDSEGIWHEL